MKALFIIAVIISGSCSQQANEKENNTFSQSEASLEETMSWIKGRIDNAGIEEVEYVFNFKKCKCEEITFVDGEIIRNQKFDLTDMEKAIISDLMNDAVELHTIFKQKKVQVENYGKKSFKNYAVIIVFNDIEMVKRLVKAFNHAIKLCGGGPKEEKF